MRLPFACLLALLVPAFAPAVDKKDEKKEDKPPALAGKYECDGNNGGYKGTVEISEDGAGYKIEWAIGCDKYTGVGLWEGERLCVSWTSGDGAGHGIAVYKRDKDGTLKGKWTTPGAATLNEETLTPEKK